MSVNADFYKFSKRKNSTKQPTGTGTTYSVDLKSGTSLLAPTLLLNNSGKPDFNYCIFMGFYYFVQDIISVRNDLWEVYLVVDPLATAKSAITGSTQYVAYSSHKTSTWLADTRIPLQQNTITNYATALTGILSTIGTYVLTVVGESGCSTYYTQNESLLTQLLNSIATWESDGITSAIQNIQTQSATAGWGTHYVVDQKNTVEEQLQEGFQTLVDEVRSAIGELADTAASVMDSLNTVISTVEQAAVEAGFVGNAYANAPQCIRSCIWVPFDYALAPAGSGASPIKLGTFDTGVNMPSTSGKAVSDSTSVSIPWTYSDWRRGICEDVYLYLPLVGMVQLSGDSITHVSSLTIEWSATYTDGVICYKVKAGNEVIGSYGGQCAANYPLGIAQQASAGELAQAVIAGAEKSVSGLIQSTISPISAAGAIGGFAMNVAIAGYNIENVKKSTHISCVGGVGGGAGIGLGRDIVCYTVAHPTVINPDDMKDTMGLPTMAPMSLATLTGYCECVNAHLEADLPEPMLEAIDTYMNSGFFIE